MPDNKLLRTQCYTFTLVISLLITASIFIECYHGSGCGNSIAVKLYQTYDDKTLRLLLEVVCVVIAMSITGFLFSAIFFRSGFSRWLKNTLLRIYPDPE